MLGLGLQKVHLDTPETLVMNPEVTVLSELSPQRMIWWGSTNEQSLEEPGRVDREGVGGWLWWRCRGRRKWSL